ncbi:MAG: DUF998 domain-containing protein [Candidatus Methanomethylophilaceae archaeon]|nr:DUF998 domain-containing protein [Candidatus Methanomethylophilaceae archaeon]
MFEEMGPSKPYIISGFLVATVLGAGYILSIVLYPEWDINLNSFSDLGDSMSPSMWIFNGACMLAGILLGIFSMGYVKFGKKYSKIGGYAFIITAILMFLVGLISKAVSDTHLYFSMAFAFSFFISAAIICIQNVVDREWKYLIPTVIAGFVIMVTWILYLNDEIVKYGVAQLICFVGAFVWFLSEAVRNAKLGFGTEREN